jgi:hypothetical protein
MKLIDLHPAWIDHGDRKGLGVTFDCMIGTHHDNKPCEIRNWILFANPLDSGAPWPGESRSLILALVPDENEQYRIRGCGTSRWTRSGDTFETLSCTPSWNAHGCGHLTLTNGLFA